MTPSARVQAAIEILDEVIASARDDGPPADAIVTRYFKTRRYAGSKDRRAVRELVFRAIRRSGERPDSGRSAMLGLADDDAELLDLFDGSPHGPADPRAGEDAASGIALLPAMDRADCCRATGDAGRMAGTAGARAARPRVNVARASRDEMVGAVRRRRADPAQPMGPAAAGRHAGSMTIRHLPQGLVEVQDEGSQLIALACKRRKRHRILDLCAGAGGKSLALAAAAPGAEIIASDTNRARLAQLRAARRARRARRSRHACSMAAGKPRSWPTWQANATSCWSMLRAAGRAPGAATRKAAGG